MTIWLAMGLMAAGPLEAAVATPPPDAPPAAAAGEQPTVFAADTMTCVPSETGCRIDLMDAPTRSLKQLEIHITTLLPGKTSHPPHRHANEEVVVLRQGQLEVYVNGKTRVVGPGSVLVFLANDWHSVNNVGAEPAIYEVINFRP